MQPRLYKQYLLGVLLAVFAFNTADRLAIGLLLQDIKIDLQLSDTQLGLLTGIAFALFYSIMGIPIARWADRGNRVTIISVTTVLWSAALALCGLVGNFWHLLLIRICVAVGEAGCIPPAHSLIAEQFSRADRPRAIARYMLGGSVAPVIGLFLAGWLNQLYGWRATFMFLSVPGLVLALLVRVTLKDPRSVAPIASADEAATAESPAELTGSTPTVREVCATLWRVRTFRHLLMCFSVLSFFSYGIGKWNAAFFIRSLGAQTGELGTWLAVIFGVSGFLGTYLGGEWATRSAGNNERLQLKVLAFAFPWTGLMWACVFLSPTAPAAFSFLALAALATSAASGPLFATIQTLVPPRMRAMAIALIYLFANFIGMGIGPMAAGMLSDGLHASYGEESLRYALLALCPGYLWAAWHVARASRSVTQDLAAVHARKNPSIARDPPAVPGLRDVSR